MLAARLGARGFVRSGTCRQLSSLPVSDLPIVDLNTPDAHVQIRDAASRVGFFMIANHGVPQAQMDDTFDALETYFAQPAAVKLANHISRNDGIRGYGGLFEQGGYAIDATDVRVGIEGGDSPPTLMDMKEVFHLGRELPRSHPVYNHDMFAPNVWPDDEAAFRRAPVEQHMASMYDLSEHIFTLFARSLDLPDDYFRSLCDEGMDSMNLLHYPPLAAEDRDPEQLGIGAHTDLYVSHWDHCPALPRPALSRPVAVIIYLPDS